jgi:hypothetical protein
LRSSRSCTKLFIEVADRVGPHTRPSRQRRTRVYEDELNRTKKEGLLTEHREQVLKATGKDDVAGQKRSERRIRTTAVGKDWSVDRCQYEKRFSEAGA